MKNSIIEELLDGQLELLWEKADDSPEAREAYEEANKYANEIEALLKDEHVELWDDYTLAEGGVSRAEKIHAFRVGARFGLLFALELLEYEE